jgi:hypothetical protein
MNTYKFIKTKLSGRTPQFKELIGLKESGQTSELIDFITLLHPNQAIQAQGSRATVFGAQQHTFIIYTSGILKTTTETQKRTFYKF